MGWWQGRGSVVGASLYLYQAGSDGTVRPIGNVPHVPELQHDLACCADSRMRDFTPSVHLSAVIDPWRPKESLALHTNLCCFGYD